MADRSKRARKVLSVAIRLVVAGGLVGWLIYSGKFKPGDVARATGRPAWLLAAGGLFATCTLVSISRWWVLLAAQGVRLPPGDVIQLSFIGFVFSSYIPGVVTGDVVKAYYLARETHNKAGAVMSILVDRTLGMFTFIATAAVALAIWFALGGPWAIEPQRRPRILLFSAAVFASFLVLVAGACVLLSRRLRRSEAFRAMLGWLPAADTVRRLYDAIYIYRDRLGYLGLATALSLCLQVPIILAHYCSARAVGEASLGVGLYFFLGPMGLVINAVPLGPLGLGFGQVGYQKLFAAFRSNKGAEIISVLQIIMFAWNQLGWIFYLKGRDKYRAALAAGTMEAAAQAAGCAQEGS